MTFRGAWSLKLSVWLLSILSEEGESRIVLHRQMLASVQR